MTIKDTLNILKKQGADGIRNDIEDVSPDLLKNYTLDHHWVSQYKYDGWFVALYVKDGKGIMFSRKNTYRKDVDCTGLPDNIYFGELLENTQWSYRFKNGALHGKFIVFDQVIKPEGYIISLERLRKANQCSWVAVVDTISDKEPIDAFADAINQGFEGIILYRDGVRVKIKKVIEDDFVIMGFDISNSKTAGIKGGLVRAFHFGRDGKEIGKCGTMAENIRKAMFEHPEQFLGKTCVIRGKERFSSGALRHPSLVCIRDPQDK